MLHSFHFIRDISPLLLLTIISGLEKKQNCDPAPFSEHRFVKLDSDKVLTVLKMRLFIFNKSFVIKELEHFGLYCNILGPISSSTFT